jgi:hypothetical protein
MFYMKPLSLIGLAALLLTGCAHYSGSSGSTGTSSDINTGTGSSPDYNRTPANDMDNLGYNESYKNMKPNGQPRVPGRSVDIDNGPH